MSARLTTIIAMGLCLAFASGKEPGWVEINARPLGWADSLPLLTRRSSSFVLETPSATHLRGFPVATPEPPGPDEARIREQVAGLLEKMPWRQKVDLKIEWLAGDETPVDFTRAISPESGIIRGCHRLAGTKITRTIIADEAEHAVFIHLLADKPGALSFRVVLAVAGEGEPEIDDRRQLVRPAAAGVPDSLGARVWVLPFESDVSPAGNSIVVRGEGEALVILAFPAGNEAPGPLPETLARLGNRYDPGHSPADPTKIWQGVLAGHLKSIENSP